MKALNPKTNLFKLLEETSAALLPEHLPTVRPAPYSQACHTFEEALEHLFNRFDILSHGYDEYSKHWYASVKAPSLFSICDLRDGSNVAPYHVTGEVRASGALPADCLKALVAKVTAAEDWQRKVICLLNIDAAKA